MFTRPVILFGHCQIRFTPRLCLHSRSKVTQSVEGRCELQMTVYVPRVKTIHVSINTFHYVGKNYRQSEIVLKAVINPCGLRDQFHVHINDITVTYSLSAAAHAWGLGKCEHHFMKLMRWPFAWHGGMFLLFIIVLEE